MSLSSLMRGVVWEGVPSSVAVLDLPIPTLEASTDAIVRVTAAGICGTDLHTYHGSYGSSEPSWPMGHEAIGFVVDVGDGVTSRQNGDYVIISDVIDDGALHMSPVSQFPFGMGPERGDLGGCQSEYVRVPAADNNLIPVPGKRNTTRENDYLFVSDIFATAWVGLDFSGFGAGDSVAVFGAGPVGLLTAYTATLRGASVVYLVDHVEERLQLGESIGAIPINFMENDAASQILELEPEGVRRSVDCVGYEAVNASGTSDVGVVIRQMVNVTGIRGGIGITGIYSATQETEATPLGGNFSATVDFDLASFFRKGLTMRGGGVDPRTVAPQLVELIADGKADLSWVVTDVVGIEDAEDAYRRFSEHEESKIVVKFPWAD